MDKSTNTPTKRPPVLDPDYYVVLAPMTTVLRLTGYDLTVFAVIHSFTKDGKHRYYGSAEHIAEKWLGDIKKARSIKDSIKVLTEAGYINKLKEARGRLIINAYTTNYNTLLEKALNGEELPVLGKKRRNVEGKTSGTVPRVVPYTETSGTVPPETSGTVPPNNYILNIYKNYSLSEAAPGSKEEQEQFFKIFFFRNAANPAAEVEKFYSYNTRRGWNGGKLDTFDKRVSVAATDWKIEAGGRTSAAFLEVWRQIYCAAVEAGDAFAAELLNPKVSGKPDSCGEYYIGINQDIYNWLMRPENRPALSSLKALASSFENRKPRFKKYL